MRHTLTPSVSCAECGRAAHSRASYFINDLFNGLSYVGVPIPQGTKKHPVDPPLLLPGLLFTDDALGLTASPEELCTLCAHIGTWTAANEMRVGISKCGIMMFGSNGEGGDASDLAQCPLPNPVYDARLHIGGELVPIVTDYLYLGVTITPSLDTADLIAPRLESGRKTVMSLAPFLCCPVIPLSARIAVIRAVVMPRLLYRAEVYGMNRPDIRDAAAPQPCPLVPRPTGPLADATLPAPLAGIWLHADLHPGRRPTHPGISEVPGAFDLGQGPDHDPVRDTAVEVGHRGRPVDHSVLPPTLTPPPLVTTGDHTGSPLCRPQWVYSPILNPGIALIIRMRMGAFATTAKLIAWARLPAAEWSNHCPCCRATTHTEDIPHILLECAYWEAYRTNFLAAMLLQITVVDPEASLDRCQKSVLLLGGSVNDVCLPRWSPPPASETG